MGTLLVLGLWLGGFRFVIQLIPIALFLSLVILGLLPV
jgi:hypothetical protein